MNLPIYFISDIHLMDESSANYPKTSKNLESFFNHVSNTGGTLFINGDLIDIYFEYRISRELVDYLKSSKIMIK